MFQIDSRQSRPESERYSGERERERERWLERERERERARETEKQRGEIGRNVRVDIGDLD